MKELIREFFFLRRGERRALLFVMLLLACIIVVRYWLAWRPIPGDPDPAFYERMDELKTELLLAAELEQRRRNEERERFMEKRKIAEQPVMGERKELRLFSFDPNTIPADSLRLMNLPGFVTENMMRYRSAGGIFRKPDDIGKIYGMDTSLYKELLPFVFIEQQGSDKSSRQANPLSEFTTGDTSFRISLNEADSALLTMIPGVGQAYSTRIIKYRELLGGFYNPEQLMEVYGMDSSRYSKLLKFCVVDSSMIRWIDLNSASFKELIAHPYIDRSETYAILHYRKYANKISDPEELLTNQIIDKERFKKIAPYLTTKRINE